MFRLIGRVFGWIGRMFRNAFAVLGTMVALVLVVVALVAIVRVATDPGLPANTVLAIDAREGFTDAPVPTVLGGGPISFIDLIFALKKAEADSRVKGIILRVGGGGIAGAHAQELKQAIDAFRKAKDGRFVIAQAGSFEGPGLGQYYIASLADEIWLQQSSEVNTLGAVSTTVFLRGLFDKLQIRADISQRYEYKSAADVYTQTDYTPAHREATTRLLQSVYEALTADIAERRQSTPAAIRAMFDNAPYLTEAALNAKVIDKVGFYDDAEDAAKTRAGQGAEVVPIESYYGREGSPFDNPYNNGGTIALIAAEGPITDGASTESFLDGRTMGGDTIAGAIRDAAEDPAVKAILLRVNSPGGSALASDVILDQLRKAQGRGKKIIVSMGPVAASGGYWIAMYGDKILASPATITGSIGVLSGKVILRDTYRLLGLNPALITVGTNAAMYSEFADFTPEQRMKFEATLDQIYARFTQAVAEGRKLPLDQVREIAKGRVWSGVDAQGLKLIDRFGSLTDALNETVQVAGIDASKPLNVRLYPQISPWQTFWLSFGEAATVTERISAVLSILDTEMARGLMSVLSEADGARGQEIRMNPTLVQ